MNREELSPLWCANDAPHQPHEESNVYGDWNYCTGRPEQAHTPTEAHGKPFDTSPERVKIGADSLHPTPTDDEREALLQAADRMSPLSANPHTSLDLALVREAAYRVADGTFRRTVQGEPTPVRFVARQGGKVQSTIDALLARANEHGIRVEVVYPQGEPTDAEVLVALDEFYREAPGKNTLSNYSTTGAEAMRRALRAAAATREGENRG